MNKILIQISFSSIAVALLFGCFSKACLANCDLLESYNDQLLCSHIVFEHGIDKVELWQENREQLHSTHLEEGTSKLVIIERVIQEKSFQEKQFQAVLEFPDLDPGPLVLQQGSEEPATQNSSQMIRLEKRSVNDKTLMLVLKARSMEEDYFGSGLDSGSGLALASGNSTTPAEGTNDEGGVNPIAIILPIAAGLFLQAIGWFNTITDIYDVYFYGGTKDKLSKVSVVLSAIFTCGLNLVPHYIIYRVKRPPVPASSVV